MVNSTWNYLCFSLMFLNMGASTILHTFTTAMTEGQYSVLYALIHCKDIENIFLIVVIIF